MSNKRIAMRKIHEILRLRFEVGLSFHSYPPPSVRRILSADARPGVQLLAVLLPLPDLVPVAEALHAPTASRR